jgi:hypothetical protein
VDPLLAIQRAMTGVLFRPLTRDEGMRPEAAAVAEQIIKPNDRLTAFERLQIYNQQYWWRLLGNFNDDYRTVCAIIGTRKFDKLAVAYLEECGSTSWSLRELGQNLVAFIDRHPEYTAPHTRLAREMASLEWAKTLAFDNEERAPIDPRRIATRPAQRLKIGLQPYLILLQLEYPVDHLVRRMRASGGEAASNAVASAARRKSVRLLRAKPALDPIHIAVHRVNFSVYYKRIEPEAFRILSALRDGATLADACERGFANSPNTAIAPRKISEWFQAWTRCGWLTEWQRGK